MDNKDLVESSTPLFPMNVSHSPQKDLKDPKEKFLANWLEDMITMQRVNLVLVLLTLMMLIFHFILDIFFHV